MQCENKTQVMHIIGTFEIDLTLIKHVQSKIFTNSKVKEV